MKPTQQLLIAQVSILLVSVDCEHKTNHLCAGFQREAAWKVAGIHHWPAGLSAIQVFEHCDALGLTVPLERGSVPGDHLVWWGPGHSAAGHIELRMPGNAIAGNSSSYEKKNGDCRGSGRLLKHGEWQGIIRLWH